MEGSSRLAGRRSGGSRRGGRGGRAGVGLAGWLGGGAGRAGVVAVGMEAMLVTLNLGMPFGVASELLDVEQRGFELVLGTCFPRLVGWLAVVWQRREVVSAERSSRVAGFGEALMGFGNGASDGVSSVGIKNGAP